jgi:hypothetical protein
VGEATERSVASREACRVVRGPARWVGDRECRAPEIRVKAMEAVKSLECSRQGLPGVWGAERSEGDGGNWGGPPRPGSLRRLLSERRAL